MITITNGVLRFDGDTPKWWKPTVLVQTRKHKSTEGAWFVFKKLGAAKAGTPIGQDGTVYLPDIADGDYDVLKHATTSILIVPIETRDREEPEEPKRKRTVSMPEPPDFSRCSDIEFDLYILNTGRALQSQGRFSAGFPGWANTMGERFARYKMNKQGATKRLGEATPELDYYEQMMKIVSDPTVTDAVKIRALKELQAAKPKSKVKREIKRIVVPD